MKCNFEGHFENETGRLVSVTVWAGDSHWSVSPAGSAQRLVLESSHVASPSSQQRALPSPTQLSPWSRGPSGSSQPQRHQMEALQLRPRAHSGAWQSPPGDPATSQAGEPLPCWVILERSRWSLNSFNPFAPSLNSPPTSLQQAVFSVSDCRSSLPEPNPTPG